MKLIRDLEKIQTGIKSCRACPDMRGTPVHGLAIATSVILVGQAPGPHEGNLGRPFAYTAGKTLFKWLLSATHLNEEQARQKIYIASVARCFPGKNVKGAGDREPTDFEIANCRRHLKKEVEILKPTLILAVGKVAIREVLGPAQFPKNQSLVDVVGKVIKANFHGQIVDVIALPHPSGVSRWPTTEPGKTKLQEALNLIRNHKAFNES